MSVSGEIENLEYEIKQHKDKIQELKKRLDKLLSISPKKKPVWRTCVSCGGPSYNDFCGFCQEEL